MFCLIIIFNLDSDKDLTKSNVVFDVKSNDIMNIDGIAVFGAKDYNGNVQSISAIQTAKSTYTIVGGLITQINLEDAAFSFNYNSTSDEYFVVIISQNGSYQVPDRYVTPNVTFPKPVMNLSADDANIPNPFTGIVINLSDKASNLMLDDAVILMNYYDDSLGNKTIVMTNVGGGKYYAVLPTNDTATDAYFSVENLQTTISQQSNALMELLRGYPISDVCRKVPKWAEQFCTTVSEELSTKIPQSLRKAAQYSSNIAMTSKSSGRLSHFKVEIRLAGQSPVGLELNGTNNISSKSLGDLLDQIIDPSILNKIGIKISSQQGRCNEQTISGNAIPDDRTINIGQSHIPILFHYETYTIQDQIDVYYSNKQVFTSGCVGTVGERSTTIQLNHDDTSLRVNVIPVCAGDTATAWYYYIECGGLQCNDGICYCGARKRPSVKIQDATVNGCGAEDGWFNSWIEARGEKYQFGPYCNNHDRCYGTCNSVKQSCDLTFLAEMSNSCRHWNTTEERDACNTWTLRFYIAVDLWGNDAFEAAQKTDCTCT